MVTVGINNIYTKQYSIDGLPVGEIDKVYQKSVYRTTFEVEIEPRYYFLREAKSWGNIYGAIPLSYETEYFQTHSYSAQEYTAIPTLGYQLKISNHISAEAYGGIGWRYERWEPKATTNLDYAVGLRLKYSFR